MKLKNSFWKREKKYILLLLIVITIVIICAAFLPRLLLKANLAFYENRADEIKHELDNKSQELLDSAKRIANVQHIVDAVNNKDILATLTLLSEAKNKYNVEAVGATDNQGFVLTRTLSASKRGDNVFLSLSQGRKVSRGDDVASIELNSFNQLSLVAGTPIKKDNKLVGAIFTSAGLNSSFATAWKEKLPEHPDIVFYTKLDGVTGDSMNDEASSKLLNLYFSPKSDWIINGRQEGIIEMPNGKRFYLINIVFPGLENSPGGMLVLFPYHQKTQILFVTLSAMVFFYVMAVLVHFLIRNVIVHRHHPFTHYIFSALIVMGVTVFFFYISFNNKIIKISKPDFTIYNSTLSFDPGTAIFSASAVDKVGIRVTSGGELINGFNTVINYDPKSISIDSIDTVNSICPEDLFIEKNIDAEKGVVNISCIVPNPGFNSKTGLIAELVIHSLDKENFTLKFDPKTQVLANDGLATNVLRYSEDGSYTLIDDTKPNTSLIYSQTQPNSEKWYNTKDVKFVWNMCKDCWFSPILNQDKTISTSQFSEISTSSQFSATVLSDGVYYFHLLNKINSTNSIVSQKVLIDTEPPLPPKILVSSNTVKKSEVVRFIFDSNDSGSGMQRNFYIKYDDGIFLPVGRELYSSFDSSGDHQATVRAYDLAGNYSQSTITIHVK